MLVVADELGPEGSEAYALGNAYGLLLDPEAASAAAEALNEGLLAAIRPAAEPPQHQKPEFLGVQAEVLLKALPVICLLPCHCKVRHCDASLMFLRSLHLGAGPVYSCPCDVSQHAQAGSTIFRLGMLHSSCRHTVQRSRCCRTARWGNPWRAP